MENLAYLLIALIPIALVSYLAVEWGRSRSAEIVTRANARRQRRNKWDRKGRKQRQENKT